MSEMDKEPLLLQLLREMREKLERKMELETEQCSELVIRWNQKGTVSIKTNDVVNALEVLGILEVVKDDIKKRMEKENLDD